MFNSWIISTAARDLKGLTADDLAFIRRHINKARNQMRPRLLICAIIWVGAYWVWVFWLSRIVLGTRLYGVFGCLEMLAVVIVATLMTHWMCWRQYMTATRRAMRDRGYDVCIGCGYWLRGLNDDVTRCPECGAAREAMPDDSIATEGSS